MAFALYYLFNLFIFRLTETSPEQLQEFTFELPERNKERNKPAETTNRHIYCRYELL